MYEDSAQKIVEKILQLTSLSDRLVLEIGCGDGRITSLLFTHTTQLVAIDPDPDANLMAIPRKQRAMIRKGIKAGLVAETDQDVGRPMDAQDRSGQ